MVADAQRVEVRVRLALAVAGGHAGLATRLALARRHVRVDGASVVAPVAQTGAATARGVDQIQLAGVARRVEVVESDLLGAVVACAVGGEDVDLHLDHVKHRREAVEVRPVVDFGARPLQGHEALHARAVALEKLEPKPHVGLCDTRLLRVAVCVAKRVNGRRAAEGQPDPRAEPLPVGRPRRAGVATGAVPGLHDVEHVVAVVVERELRRRLARRDEH